MYQYLFSTSYNKVSDVSFVTHIDISVPSYGEASYFFFTYCVYDNKIIDLKIGCLMMH